MIVPGGRPAEAGGLRGPLRVEREVGSRLRAADERAAGRRLRERFRLVADFADHQPALAVIAGPAAAAEAHRNVAGLGQLKQAPEGRVPRHGQLAAAEGDQRLGPGGCGGRAGSPTTPGLDPLPGPKTSVRTPVGQDSARSRQVPRTVRGALAYATAKAATEGLSRALAVDYSGRGIKGQRGRARIDEHGALLGIAERAGTRGSRIEANSARLHLQAAQRNAKKSPQPSRARRSQLHRRRSSVRR